MERTGSSNEYLCDTKRIKTEGDSENGRISSCKETNGNEGSLRMENDVTKFGLLKTSIPVTTKGELEQPTIKLEIEDSFDLTQVQNGTGAENTTSEYGDYHRVKTDDDGTNEIHQMQIGELVLVKPEVITSDSDVTASWQNEHEEADAAGTSTGIGKSDSVISNVGRTDRKSTVVSNMIACHYCEYKCDHSSKLKRHVMKAHKVEKPFGCDLCDYKCIYASDFKRHLMTHSGEKRFACDKCGYECIYAGNLKRHLMTHTGEKPFSCNMCDYRCRQASELKKHVMTHTGEKPFVCDMCDYKTVQASELKKHVMTHTGEKPFACEMCDYRCISPRGLKRHLMTHTGKRRFACDICDCSFIRGNDLYRHSMMHMGEKPLAI